MTTELVSVEQQLITPNTACPADVTAALTELRATATLLASVSSALALGDTQGSGSQVILTTFICFTSSNPCLTWFRQVDLN